MDLEAEELEFILSPLKVIDEINDPERMIMTGDLQQTGVIVDGYKIDG